MPISNDLFLAILAMDAYNRGYGAGLADGGQGDTDGLGESGFVGNARILARSDSVDYDAWQAAGFYAVAYSWNGKTVISYRGTDNVDFLTTGEGGSDFWQGWTVGAGFTGGQAPLALEFYTAATGRPYYEVATNTILTGHSLGGGLAGFLSALSGTPGIGFDHMPFGVAAANDNPPARLAA